MGFSKKQGDPRPSSFARGLTRSWMGRAAFGFVGVDNTASSRPVDETRMCREIEGVIFNDRLEEFRRDEAIVEAIV
jgi:hypothetical protein